MDFLKSISRPSKPLLQPFEVTMIGCVFACVLILILGAGVLGVMYKKPNETISIVVITAFLADPLANNPQTMI